MSCSHEAHSHERHHDHDGHDGHDHDGPDRGFEFTLYQHIDTGNVVCLNEAEPGSASKVFKSWEERFERETATISDADEQLLFKIPFLGSVKIKSIAILGGPDGKAPAEMSAFVNREQMDFESAETTTPTQTWELVTNLPRGQLPEYPTRIAKFTGVHHLSLYIPKNHGDDETRITYIGLKGEFTPASRNPVITMYEAAARPVDHPTKTGASDALNRMIE